MIIAFTDLVVPDTIRTLTIILGSIACGGMLRFYWAKRNNRGMPSPAMAAFFLMSLYIILTTAVNIGEPWIWYQTPVAFLGFVFVLVGVNPYIKIKKH